MHKSTSGSQPHNKTAWILIAGLRHDLTEGDVITVFSQFGEVVNINLPRHKETGESRGFCFLCYQDLNSTILAVENLNGITLLGRKLKVDYVENYKVPKYSEDADEEVRRLWEDGCAPKPILLAEREEKESHRKHKMRSSKRRNVKKHSLYGTKKLGRRSTPSKISKDPLEKSPPRSKRSPVYNPRPDFQKADWRDVEIWRVIQNRDRTPQQLKNTHTAGSEYDAPFIPKRYH
ncbi:hypothetical protein OESDEN_05143 [Oesophagostomum dentatum]|uniref:RRM domain-containing protein n=1 Tax=Oesophagostomum dentatum TaxID=61180 RepID=A0A0B1TGG0_OESDE|nr:hypothetical protein OESDEN_05143 [Oesophagostomum dentatum]